MTPAEALQRRIKSRSAVADSGCWEWAGSRKPNGYGEMTIDNRRHYAHRVSYGVFVGPIPDGLHIDHLCRNRACVNPAHLEPVTQGENTRRGWRGRQTHACPQGHNLNDPDNVYRRANGGRECRPCSLTRAAAARGDVA